MIIYSFIYLCCAILVLRSHKNELTGYLPLFDGELVSCFGSSKYYN